MSKADITEGTGEELKYELAWYKISLLPLCHFLEAGIGSCPILLCFAFCFPFSPGHQVPRVL